MMSLLAGSVVAKDLNSICFVGIDQTSETQSQVSDGQNQASETQEKKKVLWRCELITKTFLEMCIEERPSGSYCFKFIRNFFNNFIVFLGLRFCKKIFFCGAIKLLVTLKFLFFIVSLLNVIQKA